MESYTLWQINIDPENQQFLMETSLPTPTTARVYVNLPEGNLNLDPHDLSNEPSHFGISDRMQPGEPVKDDTHSVGATVSM